MSADLQEERGKHEMDAEVEAADNLAALAGKLALVREQMAALRDLDADLTAAIVAAMDSQQTSAGQWRVERFRGSNRKGWDSPGLFSHLIRTANFDPKTGEKRTDAAARNLLIELVEECVPLTQSLGWRAGALRGRGINPDEWCQVTPGAWRVDVTLDSAAAPQASEAGR